MPASSTNAHARIALAIGRISGEVVDMNHGARAQHAAGRANRARAVGPAAALGDEGPRSVVEGDQAEELAVAQIEVTEAGGAETHRIRQHGVEHRLKLAWRTGDDAQHLGRGGLLLQRFAQLVEQPGVFDRDDGLISKILN